MNHKFSSFVMFLSTACFLSACSSFHSGQGESPMHGRYSEELSFDCRAEQKHGLMYVDIVVHNVNEIPISVKEWTDVGYSHNFQCRFTKCQPDPSSDSKRKIINALPVYDIPSTSITSVESQSEKIWEPGEKQTFTCMFVLRVPEGDYDMEIGFAKTDLWARKKKRIKVIYAEIDHEKIFRK